LNEVVACLSSLTLNDYKETKFYPDSVFDVYVKDFERGEDTTDKIYMKLRLSAEGEIEVLEVGSFHL